MITKTTLPLQQIAAQILDDEYWGTSGAIARAKGYYTRFTTSNQSKLKAKAGAHVALAAVYYSASLSAQALIQKDMSAPLWMFRYLWCLIQAWRHTAKCADYCRFYPGMSPTADELDLIQCVARKYLRVLGSYSIWRSQYEKAYDCAYWAIEESLSFDQDPLSRALLLVGKADLYRIDGEISINLYETLREVWLIALSASQQEYITTQDKRCIAKVFRHLIFLTKSLPDTLGNDPSPSYVHSMSITQMKVFEETSRDQ